MRRIILVIVLLTLIVQSGFGKEEGQPRVQMGFNAGYFVLGGDLAANSFGVNMKFHSSRSTYADEIAFNYWNDWHNDKALYTLHWSRLFRANPTRTVDMLIGPGISIFLHRPFPFPHLKSVLVIRLNKSVGIEVGAIVPVIFITAPGIHAGFYGSL